MQRKQLQFFAKSSAAYGGELLKKRKGRRGPRPLDTRQSMHLVLRSSQAKGAWSFRRHQRQVLRVVDRFCKRYGVKLLSLANVGNHLHFHIKLSHRSLYRPFIRALTSAIAMAVTGASRLKPLATRFWDYRPFTRIILGRRAFLNLKDYIQINQFEGLGFSRNQARILFAKARAPT